MSRNDGFAVVVLAASLAASACAARTAPAPGEVPKGLNGLAALAEDGFDLALAGDEEGLRAASGRLATLWSSLRETVADDGAPAADVAAMDAALAEFERAVGAAADRTALARAANGVSLRAEAMFEIYRPAIPTAVLRLDLLGRELVLDGMQADLPGASGHAADLSTTWRALREQVVGAGGAKTAALFDGSVAALRGAVERRDAGEVGRLAMKVRDDVDVLEAVF
jgi:hypothetical protein